MSSPGDVQTLATPLAAPQTESLKDAAVLLGRSLLSTQQEAQDAEIERRRSAEVWKNRLAWGAYGALGVVAIWGIWRATHR